MIHWKPHSVVLACLTATLGAGHACAWNHEWPNIVIIYADDLGYGDVACYNPDRGKIATPHIDRLAARGMRFTDAHSSSGVCSPSRYTLLTGRYHWRTRLQKGIVGLWERPLIAPDRTTIAGLLRRNGYRTACFGKWHLGWDWPVEDGKGPLFRGSKTDVVDVTPHHQAAWQHTFSRPIGGGPTTRGFEEYFGTDVPNWPPFCFIDHDRTVGVPSEFLPLHLFRNHLASVQGPALADWSLEPILPAIANRTCDYISRMSREEQPFLIYMPLTAPHTPLAVNQPWRGQSGLNPYADFVMETDATVGRVLDALDQNGIADNTLVVFTSDNGCAPYAGAAELEQLGHFPSGPYRGYKSDAWEGGHRVPFIVRWPGHVDPDSTCHELVHQADLFATCADVIGVQPAPDEGEDSFSLLPLLAGDGKGLRTDAVSQSGGGLIAIRQGTWKLIAGPGSGGWSPGRDEWPGQLYDLSDDPGESENRYASRPDKVAELTKRMEQLCQNGRSNPGPAQPNDRPLDWKPPGLNEGG